MRKALFTGTFDPYTIGHDSIVQRALSFMDEIVIAVVERNVRKQTLFSTEQRVRMIQELYADEPRIKVLPYGNLAVDFAKEQGAQFIIRGVRSTSDFVYEKELAEINKRLSGIETILLLNEPELACVSSSTVRELLSYGKDVTAFLPKGMKLIKE